MRSVIIDQNDLKYELDYTFSGSEDYSICLKPDQTRFSFRGTNGEIRSQTPAKGYSNQLIYELAKHLFQLELKKSRYADGLLFYCYVRKLES